MALCLYDHRMLLPVNKGITRIKIIHSGEGSCVITSLQYLVPCCIVPVIAKSYYQLANLAFYLLLMMNRLWSLFQLISIVVILMILYFSLILTLQCLDIALHFFFFFNSGLFFIFPFRHLLFCDLHPPICFDAQLFSRSRYMVRCASVIAPN